MNTQNPNSGVVIEIDANADAPDVDPGSAPPLPDEAGLPQATPVTAAAGWMGQKPSRLGRWFAGLLASFVGLVASVAAWNFVAGLLASQPLLGRIATVLIGLLVLIALIWAVREAAGFARLARLDRIQRQAGQAMDQGDVASAKVVAERVAGLSRGRPEMEWALANHAQAGADLVDADSLLLAVEHHLMVPLDRAAQAEIEAAARKVATATALVPLALADVAAALVLNLRMIRTVAEIYGGRSGALGNWRLTRQVLAHLVTTGAVAIGDDLLEPLVGGGLMSKLSRRFGEGLVNGALTARVGLAAMDVCRPLPRIGTKRPKVRTVIAGALGGLFKPGGA